MKIVIIEDEKLAAEDLSELIMELQPDSSIVKSIRSVKEGIDYFRNNDMPDLIFSDIQLGDGLSFDIFTAVAVTTPIIFCTAYDEYALNAFKTTGIDYILKPITSTAVNNALSKYHSLRKGFTAEKLPYDLVSDLFLQKSPQKISSVLVNYKDRIIPIKMAQIALFYIEYEETYLLSFDNKMYPINRKMEELERIAGDDFFRVNRQCLVNREAVQDAAHFFSRKLIVNLSVPFKQKITISKEKTPLFLDWLSNR